METHTTFGDIRSVLHAPASDERWSELCACVEKLEHDRGRWEDELNPYITHALADDPTPREAPRSWIAAMLAGSQTPRVWGMAFVTTLNAKTHQLTPPQLAHVLADPLLGGLTRLSAVEIKLDTTGASALGKLAPPPSLTHVDLSYNMLDHAGLIALNQRGLLDGLESLNLAWNDLGDSGAQRLRERCDGAALVELDIEGNNISEDAATKLLSSGWLEKIERLRLGWNNIGPAGLTALLESDYAERLTHLGLENNNLDDASVCALVASTRLTKLTHLYLHKNALGLAVSSALETARHWHRLEHLELTGLNIPEEIIQELGNLSHLSRALSDEER